MGCSFYIHTIKALKVHVLSVLISTSESVYTSETVMQMCTNHPFIAKIIAVQITEQVSAVSRAPSNTEFKTIFGITFSTPTMSDRQNVRYYDRSHVEKLLRVRQYFEHEKIEAQSSSTKISKEVLQPLA